MTKLEKVLATPSLFREFHERVRRYVRSYGVTDMWSDDVAQTVMYKAWRSVDVFDDTRPLIPWLFAIARNSSIDHFNTEKAEKEEMPNVADLNVEDMRALGLYDTQPIVARDRPDIIEVLDELPARYKELLVRHYIYGDEWTELAAEEGITKGGMDAKAWRARQKFKEIWNNRYGDNYGRQGRRRMPDVRTA